MNKYNRLSLTQQVSIMLFIMVMVVFVIFTTVATKKASTAILQIVENQLQSEVKLMSSNLEFFYESLISSTDQLGNIFFNMFPNTIQYDTTQQLTIGNENLPVLTHNDEVLNNNFQFPDQFTRMTGGTATIFMRNGDDFLRVSTSLRKEDGERAFGTYLGTNHPGYQKLLAGETYFGPASLFGRNYMAKYTPIKDSANKVIGILYVGFDYTKQLALLKEKIANTTFGNTGYPYAISAAPNNAGVLVMHPSLEGTNLVELTDASGKKPFNKLLETEHGTFHYQWKGPNGAPPEDKLVAFHKVNGFNWVIAAGSYTREFIGGSIGLRNELILLSLASVFIIVVLIVLILRAKLRPLGNIISTLKSLSNGNLNVQLDTSKKDIETSRNEVDILSLQSLNMVNHLRSVIIDMKESAHTLDGAMSKLSTTMSNAQNDVKQQQSETEQVATAINQMAVTAQDVAKNAGNAAEQTKLADTQALKGKQEVSNVVASINELASEVEKAAGVIAKVEHESDNIGSVLAVIQGIAEQTNLLALNAAIEAARAGEQGRGFAVVADEVRTLAKRTQESTTEIKQLIDCLQESTRAAVTAMNQGKNKASDSVERSQHAGNALDEITLSVSQVADMNIQIASAAEEQTAVTEEINQRVESIREIANSSIEGAQEMREATHELDTVSKKLQDNVNRFTLS